VIGHSHRLMISAAVQGTRPTPYRVNLTLLQQQEEIWIQSHCNCPVGHDCKHGAAAAYAYLRHQHTESGSGRPRSAAERWLEALLHMENTHPEGTEEPENPLRYSLQLDSEQILHIRVLRLQSKPRGQTQPRVQDLISLTSSSPPPGTRPEDQEIARLLRAESFGRYGSSQGSGAQPPIPLNSSLGALALEKMLASGRCIWQNSDLHLTPGAARPLAPIWESQNSGERLSLQVEPPATVLLLTPALRYLDLSRGEIGPIETTLDTALLGHLLKAPEIPTPVLKAALPRLYDHLPELNLPLPPGAELELRELKDLSPIPHLTLTVVGGETPHHLALLEFAYADVRLSTAVPREVQILSQQGQRLKIYRDLSAEQKACEQLQATGLQRLPWKDPRVSEPPLHYGFEGSDLLARIMAWDRFLHTSLPQLEAAGWVIHRADQFLRIEESEHWFGELAEQAENGWFELSLGIEIQGEQINLLPLLVNVLRQAENPRQLRNSIATQGSLLLPLNASRWIRVPAERLLSILDTLIELYDREPLNQEGRLELSHTEGLQLHQLLNDPDLNWQGAESLQQLSRQLQNFTALTETPPPPALQTTLRPYQLEGLSWLQFLRELKLGGILADDMGLGKTVQALAHILMEKQNGRLPRPALVIAPASLLFNWQREAARFTPDLKTLVLHGSQRTPLLATIEDHDLVITTYALARQDLAIHRQHVYPIILLDEAQNIKNPSSKTAQALFQLRAQQRLALTGTPMENHLAELWSLYRFVMPGFLGPLDRFTRLFRTPIEKLADTPRRLQLQERIRPFLLRRTKQAVLQDLPEKTEIIRYIPLEGKQRDLYETLRLAMDARVREEVEKLGLQRSRITILDALLKLRQLCCDPRLLNMQEARGLQKSAKLEALMEMIPAMVEEGGRILVFSQFVSMLELIEAELTKIGLDYALLTGQTRQRQIQVDRFQNREVPIFLISLKAGGVGLNLTAADTVIHYDPWWNPAVENQATDRAWRMGQDKQVFVYKLIAEKTLEEKILTLQARKKNLVSGIYAETAEGEHAISADELLRLLQAD
jgi:superfamily II DNA or RNA helicase